MEALDTQCITCTEHCCSLRTSNHLMHLMRLIQLMTQLKHLHARHDTQAHTFWAWFTSAPPFSSAPTTSGWPCWAAA